MLCFSAQLPKFGSSLKDRSHRICVLVSRWCSDATTGCYGLAYSGCARDAIRSIVETYIVWCLHLRLFSLELSARVYLYSTTSLSPQNVAFALLFL